MKCSVFLQMTHTPLSSLSSLLVVSKLQPLKLDPRRAPK